MFRPSDPIGVLVLALQERRPPPFEWVLEWSQGGCEPVAGAWRASHDAFAMIQLLAFAGPAWAAAVQSVSLRSSVAASRSIRLRVPVPPTLEVLLEARGCGTSRTPSSPP